jgi:hypothetical protein
MGFLKGKLTRFLENLHWVAMGGLFALLVLLFAISMSDRSVQKTQPSALLFGVEENASSAGSRSPASEDLEKSLQLVIKDPLLLSDLKKVTDSARCAMDTQCRLKNGPWTLYQAVKGRRSSFDNRQYRKVVDDLVEFVLTQAEQKRIDPQSPFFQELKKVLNDYYQEQQDCWSCNGSSEFHRYYLLTGEKPASLRIQGEDEFDGSPELAPPSNER